MGGHRIEIIELNGFGVAIDGKIYDKGFLYYEAKACKEQLEMLPDDMQDYIIDKLNRKEAKG